MRRTTSSLPATSAATSAAIDPAAGRRGLLVREADNLPASRYGHQHIKKKKKKDERTHRAAYLVPLPLVRTAVQELPVV